VFITSESDILHPGDVDGVELVGDGRLVTVDTDRLPLYWTEPNRVAQEVLDTLSR
jgi:hypothetical protein